MLDSLTEEETSSMQLKPAGDRQFVLDIVKSARSVQWGIAYFSQETLKRIYASCGSDVEENGSNPTNFNKGVAAMTAVVGKLDMATPFIFDRTGYLRDGRKRIKALIDSGVPGIMHSFVIGVDPEHAFSIDDTRRRSKPFRKVVRSTQNLEERTVELSVETFSIDDMRAALVRAGCPYELWEASKLMTLREDIVLDLFVLNGQTVKFDAHGILVDGCRRFAAAIAAGKPLRTMVARNCRPDRSAYNHGTEAYGHDMVHRNGLKPYDIPGTITQIYRIETQVPFKELSKYRISQLHHKYASVQRSIIMMQKVEFCVTVDVAASVHYHIALHDMEIADSFAFACREIMGKEGRIGPHESMATSPGLRTILNLAKLLITDAHIRRDRQNNLKNEARRNKTAVPDFDRLMLNSQDPKEKYKRIVWFMLAFKAWRADEEIDDFEWHGDKAFPSLIS